MADTVSFKVYLTNEGVKDAKDEVRRFGIDKEVATNFDYLREKLQTVFAELRGKYFTVQWKDEDNDNVTISSDEELLTALTETQGQTVRKLYVVLHSEYPPQAQEVRPTDNKEPGAIHVGVVCDGCEKAVQGFRYKCIQCPDYDLCGDCEAQGVHSHHCMIRISLPMQWRPHYGKKLAHHVNRFVKKAGSGLPKDETQNECPFQHKRRHARSSGRCPEGPSWLDTLATYLNDWANLPGETQCPMKQSSANQKPEAGDAAKTSGGKQHEDVHVELLKNIGENIAQMLDPLGISVDVQVAGDKKSSDPPSAGSSTQGEAQVGESSSSSKFPGEGKKLVDSSDDSKKSTPVVTPPRSEAATPPPSEAEAPNAERSSPENEGWTLLNQGSEPTPGSSSSENIPQQVQPSAPEQPSTPAKKIYPELPKERVIHHADPKIQQSVERMMQMGFSNDGGWLTQLLVAKNGDIGKALDILQPVRR